MGDRRVGDRRTKEKGVITLSLKESIIYLSIAIVLIASVSLNIVLFRINKTYEGYIKAMDNIYSGEYDEEYLGEY